jgi:hypothetical protein
LEQKPLQQNDAEKETIDAVEDTHVVIFKPNEGPQTEFLAASEREVSAYN